MYYELHLPIYVSNFLFKTYFGKRLKREGAKKKKRKTHDYNLLLLYIGVTSSILIGYKHAANSCLLCFSYVIPTNNTFYICRIDVIPTDNKFKHAEVTSPNTLTSSLISFVMAELSSGICIIKQLLNSVFA